MSAIHAVSQVTSTLASAATTAAASATGTSASVSATPEFGSLLSGAIEQVQQLQQSAQRTVEGLLSGNGTDVHTAMIATEKADLAFETTLAIRNKAVAAYQQLMNLQF